MIFLSIKIPQNLSIFFYLSLFLINQGILKKICLNKNISEYYISVMIHYTGEKYGN
ncbi:hypothetical protein NEF87_004511 [Candidatus Lokiarchaeum ossiferum]|uniref:Uncharacterized protein n=1 Tax=Candidatus Lokiarchaeum ossiferum TaxID=2951803 RepID=A0ABY6I078_9ARCH|nr:hypothetical protein NEF87_004511 [Candidatus Lokiarchaeum sp. B-35]